MKKRTTAFAIAGFLLAGAMCVGFAACGKETAENIASEEVDEATWNTALDLSSEAFDNFGLGIEIEGSEKAGNGEINGHDTAKFAYDHKKTYGKVTSEVVSNVDVVSSGKTEVEYYYDRTGDSPRCIVKKDAKWVEESNPLAMLEIPGVYIMVDVKDTLRMLLGGFSISYGDYEYSEEEKGYVKKEVGQDGTITVIKFKDGKLRAIYQKVNISDPTHELKTINSLIISYGGQSVTVPQV